VSAAVPGRCLQGRGPHRRRARALQLGEALLPIVEPSWPAAVPVVRAPALAYFAWVWACAQSSSREDPSHAPLEGLIRTDVLAASRQSIEGVPRFTTPRNIFFSIIRAIRA